MTDLIVGGAVPRSAAPPGSRQASGSRPGRGRRPEGRRGGERPTTDDSSVTFAPAVLALRWATTAVSIVLASPELLVFGPSVSAWVAVVLANTVVRTFRPIPAAPSRRSSMLLALEIGLHVVAVVATGHWDSSLALLLMNGVVVAGFSRGFPAAIQAGVLSTLAVTASEVRTDPWTVAELSQAVQWTTFVLLGGLIAAYARRISGEASRRHSMALDRVARLADANALLADLHRVAQTLPASLDLSDVLHSTMTRLRGIIEHDGAFIALRDEADETWTIAAQRGVGSSTEIALADMPGPLRHTIETQKLVRVADTERGDRSLGPTARSAVLVPLLARSRLIGVLGVESSTPDRFTPRDEQLMRGFVEPVALAIDNARWFERIRRVAADEERTRIARDLHDRIGQSLAYLGVEIDRMIRRDDQQEPNGENLRRLRDDLREVLGEIRDTLSDLRAEVTDTRDFASTAREFADRLSIRSGLNVELECDASRRLSILPEREMWRIAQEALVNVERHAEATTAIVRWRNTDEGTLLEVADDGKGLPARSADGRLGRPDSYGILGMRERANSVGATLELISKPGEGTTVRCFLPRT